VNLFKVILGSLAVSGLLSCSANSSPNAIQDFAFVIQDEQNRYDSKAGLFTRFYANKDSTVQVQLDSTELNQIHSLFVEVDFRKFPQEFEDKCSSIPTFRITLSFTEAGLNYKSAITEPCDYPLLQQRQIHGFRQLEKAIWQIVTEKRAVKAMRAGDMLFL
jgi:hypothetical protein